MKLVPFCITTDPCLRLGVDEPTEGVQILSHELRTLWALDEKRRLWSSNLDDAGSFSPWRLISGKMPVEVADDP